MAEVASIKSPHSLLPRLRPVRALLTLVKALIVAVGSLEVLFLLLLAMTGDALSVIHKVVYQPSR
ncbi:hypothetical protein [Rathayibacter agropyri]|uniref:hypothetical protein n=1 Tax=Rathayibacter agropyri TaxID=1634927 RepID=UPI001564C501|nr:hypothetical protein [Rathayibacter agropyri]NRD10127.1 hypothetical protein [Rathayibacter agropyri]